MLAYLKRLDVLGHPVALTVAGKATFQTYVGALLSLVYLTLSSVAAYVIIAQFFDTKYPTVVQTTQTSSDFQTMELYQSQFAHTILIIDSNGKFAKADEYLNYGTWKSVQQTIKPNYLSPEKRQILESIPIEIVPCKNIQKKVRQELYAYAKNDENFFKIQDNHGLCLNPSTTAVYVRGKQTDETEVLFSWTMLPCSLPSGCINEQKMRGAKVMLIEPQYSLNFSNLETPALPVPIPISPILIDPGSFMQLDYAMKQNKIIDSYGFLRSDKQRMSFVDVSKEARVSNGRNGLITKCAAGEESMEACPPYLKVEIHASGTTLLMERSYRSITDTFGDIGGLKEILLLVISFFYGFYNQFFLKKFVADKVFDLKNNMQEFSEAILLNATPESRNRNKPKLEREIQKIASESVEQTTDVIRLIKEINKLRILFEFVFGSHFEGVESFIVLGLAKQKNNSAEAYESGRGAKSSAETRVNLRALEAKPQLGLKQKLENLGRYETKRTSLSKVLPPTEEQNTLNAEPRKRSSIKSTFTGLEEDMQNLSLNFLSGKVKEIQNNWRTRSPAKTSSPVMQFDHKVKRSTSIEAVLPPPEPEPSLQNMMRIHPAKFFSSRKVLVRSDRLKEDPNN